MLILTRKIGQKILIGEDIEVVLLDAFGNQAKIGINAPDDCVILREEIKDRPHLKKNDFKLKAIA